MSQVIYSGSFTSDSLADERLFAYSSNNETSTLSRGPMQSLEFSPLMTGPEPQGISYTGNVVHDSLPVPHTTTTPLTGHHGDPTHYGGHHVPIAPGPPQLEYYAPAHPDLPNDPLGYVPVQDNAAEPSQGNPNPINFGMSDDEDLKRLASRYLNNRGAHVDELLVRRRLQGGRRVLISLEIDDNL